MWAMTHLDVCCDSFRNTYLGLSSSVSVYIRLQVYMDLMNEDVYVFHLPFIKMYMYLTNEMSVSVYICF